MGDILIDKSFTERNSGFYGKVMFYNLKHLVKPIDLNWKLNIFMRIIRKFVRKLKKPIQIIICIMSQLEI